MRRIALVTVARSDWGIYRSVLERLAVSPEVDLSVVAGGMHLSPTFGMTVEIVEADCARVAVPVRRVAMPLVSDEPLAVAEAMGAGVQGFASAYAELRPDIVLVLGDRYEMFSAVAAAVPFVIPVFHIHGGERTAGAIDDALRHAMTKLSHYHLVSTPEYGRRVRQMGEDAWRIEVCGAPALDALDTLQEVDIDALGARIATSLREPFALVVFHPTTLEPGDARAQGVALVSALEQAGVLAVFLMPNADPGGLALRAVIRDACSRKPTWRMVENLRFDEYLALMKTCRFMIGNSSSGLIEAPSMRTAVINVGRRQEGRVRGTNVVDVGGTPDEILDAVARVEDEAWRASALTGVNPYYAGGAAERIVDACLRVPMDRRLTNKGFVDGPIEQMRPAEDVCVSPSVTLREVMSCIDRNRCGIALVVDSDERLIAAVTDGDVRRALLRNFSLDQPVRDVIDSRRQPAFAEHPVDISEIIDRMRRLKIRQMPVLRGGRVLGLLMLEDLA